jgi:hypothetical protein
MQIKIGITHFMQQFPHAQETAAVRFRFHAANAYGTFVLELYLGAELFVGLGSGILLRLFAEKDTADDGNGFLKKLFY